ncbi:hypothetical protein B0H11DRAFT_2088732 [Mycena galericulata]|nr:hypothetical protein B0H11DRAFT_2088732 [Mycena galericulata]
MASLQRIWQWTLTPEAVAPCFAKDVLEMRESGVKDAEYFWLGRVPCRSVKLAGLLVGVQVYETRIVYYLDDGSAVVECNHRLTAPALNKKDAKAEPSPLKPVAYVGDSVFIVGRVTPWRNTRRVVIDSIEKCPSANDEPRHWIAVRVLHRTHYSLDEPFEIPARPAPQPPPTTNVAPVLAPTPSTSSSAPSSAFNSPVKSTSSQASPHRLRHPSRLHTQDLTDNAFRIYLKHYMDNADDLPRPPPVRDFPSTPTKSIRNRLPLGDETPRPTDRTPRQIIPLNFARPFAPEEEDVDPEPDAMRGFTMSYLRRVPELALMAKRVVKAEAKRRAREARKKAKEGGGASQVLAKAMRNDQQKLHPRMKRLFNWAILQLVKDGDVVSWDGPMRPCAVSGDVDEQQQPDPDTSGLWKLNSSHSTDDDDEGVLTDPEPGEEGFISLTPAFMASHLEDAIRTLMAQATRRRAAQAQASTALRPNVGGPAPGPTVGEITAFLKNDDMWRNLSDFTVQEALEYLRDEGQAWMIGGGRWELSL